MCVISISMRRTRKLRIFLMEKSSASVDDWSNEILQIIQTNNLFCTQQGVLVLILQLLRWQWQLWFVCFVFLDELDLKQWYVACLEALFTQEAEHLAKGTTKNHEAHRCEWECSHMQATSKDRRVNLCASVSCVNEAEDLGRSLLFWYKCGEAFSQHNGQTFLAPSVWRMRCFWVLFGFKTRL